MTQLTYNEAFDPYHTAFRLLRLDSTCNFGEPVHFDLIRILDFYLLFPFRLQSIRLFSADTEWRRISKAYLKLSPYGDLPEDVNLFSRMEHFQRAALTSLANSGVISKTEWERNEVKYLSSRVPEEMHQRFKELNKSMPDVVEILCAIKEKYPLLGRDGLKDRTGLLEYRYDAV